AGVSHQTVSRVINDNPSVKPATRERVLTAIRDLAFVPSPMARGLISNRTRSIGIVTDDISDYFFARVAAGAEVEARRRGYYLMIGSVEPEDDEEGYLRLMLERRVEGLILARPSVPLAPADLDAARLLERGAQFTALFAHSDLIALGAIRQLRDAGLRVPDDVSIVGYDDLPVAEYVEPALTTVHQPMREVGALAVGFVLDQLSGG